MDYLFVSSWKRESGHGGISQYILDPVNGKLKFVRSILEDVSFNVSFMDTERNILYVLNEAPDQPGYRFGGGGSIYALKLDPETGDIVNTERYPAYCTNPCNMKMTQDGHRLIVTGHGTKNYVTRLVLNEHWWHTEVMTDSSPVILFEVRDDGTIGEILDVKQHEGSGPTRKQMIPHPHSVAEAPEGGIYAICDKGNDTVYTYKIADDRLICCAKSIVPAGTEPRYAVFHPTQKYLYHNNENSTEIHAYSYDESGNIEWIGTYDILKPDEKDGLSKKTEQQGLCISADGSFLYDVLHGKDLIAVFRIDQQNGSLSLVQIQKVDHAWPRGITLSDDGRFLALGCVTGNKVVLYRVNEDGTISFSDELDQENAAYITFWHTDN